jgi:hypothetical protein
VVDAAWLNNVRAQNQAAFGMAGLAGLGRGAQDIVRSHRDERELRTLSIHRGRFEERDPYKPTEGSIESIAQAIGPANVPQPQAPPRGMNVLVGAAVVGLVGFISYKLVQRWRQA